MLAFLPFLLLVPSTLAGLLPTVGDHSHTLDSRDSSAVSPNKTCGLVGAGLNGGYTCASTEGGPCCSQYGYCGTGDTYCLTSGGCQAKYSNASTSCYTPKAGVTVSIDGTCGITGAGKVGYRCNTTGQTCCSVAGYCGNTTEHCDVNNGCQSGYGTCTGTLKSTRRENRAKPVTLNLDIPE